mgnify:CR=1 FL=1
MSTITATYCAVCDKVSDACDSIVSITSSMATAVAASRLANAGYYKEAQTLINTLKDEK